MPACDKVGKAQGFVVVDFPELVFVGEGCELGGNGVVWEEPVFCLFCAALAFVLVEDFCVWLDAVWVGGVCVDDFVVFADVV